MNNTIPLSKQKKGLLAVLMVLNVATISLLNFYKQNFTAAVLCLIVISIITGLMFYFFLYKQKKSVALQALIYGLIAIVFIIVGLARS